MVQKNRVNNLAEKTSRTCLKACPRCILETISHHMQNACTAQYLAGVNDQISQPVPRRKKFPDHYPDQAQPDIDFHIAYYSGDRAGKYHFKKGVPPCSVQGIDEFDFFPVNSGEAGVLVHDTAEDCHGHTGNDEVRWGGAQPSDEKRRW